MKKRTGYVVERYITETAHCIENGEVADHISDGTIGEYDGVFWFEFLDGRTTRHYTIGTAPQWLLALYRAAIEQRAT